MKTRWEQRNAVNSNSLLSSSGCVAPETDAILLRDASFCFESQTLHTLSIDITGVALAVPFKMLFLTFKVLHSMGPDLYSFQ